MESPDRHRCSESKQGERTFILSGMLNKSSIVSGQHSRILSRAKVALPFYPAHFSAGQRHCFENAFVPELRLLIFLLGVSRSVGIGRFLTRIFLNLHGLTRRGNRLYEKCTPPS